MQDYLTNEQRKWPGVMALAVKRLPSKCEALSSNPNTVKRKKEKKKEK
jgi:hypothetical protein